MARRKVNSPAHERRIALEKRRRVNEMSPEEMRRELLTSGVTGLPNRRAFDEAGVASAVAMSDVDGLKALNDFGYEVGNAVLRAKADAMCEAGLEAYHDKGDEFLCRGRHNKNDLATKLEYARAILRARAIVVERADGIAMSITGADFSFGVGKDIHEAESNLKRHKSERRARGDIARGELRRIAIKNVERDECLIEPIRKRDHYFGYLSGGKTEPIKSDREQ